MKALLFIVLLFVKGIFCNLQGKNWVKVYFQPKFWLICGLCHLFLKLTECHPDQKGGGGRQGYVMDWSISTADKGHGIVWFFESMTLYITLKFGSIITAIL